MELASAWLIISVMIVHVPRIVPNKTKAALKEYANAEQDISEMIALVYRNVMTFNFVQIAFVYVKADTMAMIVGAPLIAFHKGKFA